MLQREPASHSAVLEKRKWHPLQRAEERTLQSSDLSMQRSSAIRDEKVSAFSDHSLLLSEKEGVSGLKGVKNQ